MYKLNFSVCYKCMQVLYASAITIYFGNQNVGSDNFARTAKLSEKKSQKVEAKPSQAWFFAYISLLITNFFSKLQILYPQLFDDYPLLSAHRYPKLFLFFFPFNEKKPSLSAYTPFHVHPKVLYYFSFLIAPNRGGAREAMPLPGEIWFGDLSFLTSFILNALLVPLLFNS